MAKDDWAIVVGIRLYPGLSDLEGPENDAKSFYEWVVSPAGGDVPPEQIAYISSSKFPAQNLPGKAEPAAATVQRAFDDLQDLAEQNSKAGNGLRVGRRLYIYLSGHGCAPRLNDSALLTANATPQRAGYHILGRLYADWFLRSNFFDEAILFMDCCRESYPQTPPNIPPYIDVTGADAMDKAKAFYGFGTKWSRLSRERKMADGKVHGVFTTALVEGLKGAACDPSDGRITAASLGNYLYANMKNFLSQADLDDPEIPKEPDLEYDKNPQTPLVIASVPIPKFLATINLPAGTAGKKIEILDDKFKSVYSDTATPPALKVQLTRGIYVAQVLVDGLQAPFEVNGTEAVNVNF
ncbi:MAG TPA: hypothetical protein DC054_20320 [Blastocatellia bacterium]|nr:hypothetical protein [Blastocatellia bacterium]